MKHLKNIEQLAREIKSIDCNGLIIDAALIHLKVTGEQYHEIEDEFKDAFPHTINVIDGQRLGITFNRIDFIIMYPRSI